MRIRDEIAIGLAIVFSLTVSAVRSDAQTEAKAPAAQEKPAAKPSYIGSAKCKMCHIAQHKAWAASKHAAAFAALKPDEAKKKECVGCHVVGLTEQGGTLAHAEAAVGCESCHGPGSLYGTKTMMDKKKFTADPEGMRKAWKAAGLVVPNEATCKGCHNEKSPNYKGFDFAKASAAIKHWKDKPAAPGTATGTGK